MQSFGFVITDILKTAERSIVVKTADGKERRLPRSETDFYPGKVYIPLWLAVTMARGRNLEEYFS